MIKGLLIIQKFLNTKREDNSIVQAMLQVRDRGLGFPTCYLLS